MRERILKASSVLLVFAAAILASEAAGRPAELPDIAMGWTLLFHLERAAALLGVIGIVLLIGWRAIQGEFPIKFGNVEYAKEAAAEAEQGAEEQEHRIRILEVLAGIREPTELDADQ